MINVEIKEIESHNYTKQQLIVLFAAIEKLAKITTAEIIVSSFNQGLLNEVVKRIILPIKKGYLFENKNDFSEKYAKKFDYLHPSVTLALDLEMITKLKTIKKPLNIWTFNYNETAIKINKIYDKQVAGYISDNPNLLWE